MNSDNPFSRRFPVTRQLATVNRTPDGDYVANSSSSVNEHKVRDEEKLQDTNSLAAGNSAEGAVVDLTLDDVPSLEPKPKDPAKSQYTHPDDLEVYPETTEEERRWTLSVKNPHARRSSTNPAVLLFSLDDWHGMEPLNSFRSLLGATGLL